MWHSRPRLCEWIKYADLDPEVESKYRALGFRPEGLGLKLVIAGVELDAIEHPWKGMEIGFTCFTARTMTQFAVGLPAHCSVEQIAKLIYVNFRSSFRDKAEQCKKYFKTVGIEIPMDGMPV